MRLLSFLSAVEHAITSETAAPTQRAAWETTRMVSFQRGVARLTLDVHPGSRSAIPGGAIFLQAFALADGSSCLKASLTWRGSDAFPSVSIYATPTIDWETEAQRVASAWLEGPSGVVSSPSIAELADPQLIANVG